jgi:hypothetical protein
LLAEALNPIFNLGPDWNFFSFLRLFAGGCSGFSDLPTPVAGILISFASFFILRGIFYAR